MEGGIRFKRDEIKPNRLWRPRGSAAEKVYRLSAVANILSGLFLRMRYNRSEGGSEGGQKSKIAPRKYQRHYVMSLIIGKNSVKYN